MDRKLDCEVDVEGEVDMIVCGEKRIVGMSDRNAVGGKRHRQVAALERCTPEPRATCHAPTPDIPMFPIPEDLRINFLSVLSKQLNDLEYATLLCLCEFAHSE